MTRSEDRDRAGWPVWPLVALTAVVVLLVGFAVYGFAVQASRIDALAAALAEEQEATRERGETPVAPDPSELADDPVPRVGPKGDRGRPGRDGEDGRDGRDGKDGAPGEDGRDGGDGADGEPGRDGVDGQDGAKGEPGEPPHSWTWTDQDGNRYTCTRDEGSPDSAPTYTCTREPRPGPLP